MSMAEIPTAPSNRTVLAMAKQWGWREGKRKGTEVIMIAPPFGSMTGKTCKLQTGDSSSRNSDWDMKDLVNITTSGDRSLFWRGPSDEWVKMVGEAWRKAEEELAAKKHAPPPAPPRRTDLRVITPPKPTPPVEPSAQNSRRTVGAAWAEVREAAHLLLATQPVVTSEDITRLLDESKVGDAKYRGSVSVALSKMAELQRVAVGQYALRTADTEQPPVAPEPDPEPEAQASAPEPAPEPVAPAPEPPPVAPTPTPPRKAARPEQVVMDVLDLMFPDGFKASHLPAIDVWREATVALLKEVNND